MLGDAKPKRGLSPALEIPLGWGNQRWTQVPPGVSVGLQGGRVLGRVQQKRKEGFLEKRALEVGV